MKKQLLLTVTAILASIIVTLGQIPNNVPTNGLIGYFDFNNNATDLVTSVTPDINSALPTIDRFGRDSSAYQFNGSEIVKYSNPLMPLFEVGNSLQNFTANFWMKAYSLHDAFLAGAFGWGYYVGFNSLGKVKLAAIVSGVWYEGSTNPISINEWKMITVIRTNNSTSIYVDGVLDLYFSTAPVNYNIAAYNKSNCWFGADYQDNNNYFNGELDDFGIWNRSLTQQEILNLFSSCELNELVYVQPTSQFAIPNSTAQFVVNTQYPNSSYQWQTVNGFGVQDLNDGGQYSGVNTNTLTVSNITTLNNNQPFRCVLILGECSDTTNVVYLSVTSSIEENKLGLIDVYPNPAADFITIGSNQSLSEQEYKIFDPSGKVLKAGVLHSNENRIDISNFSNGLYLLFVNGHPAQRFNVLKD